MDRKYRVPDNVHEVYIDESGKIYALVPILVKDTMQEWKLTYKHELLREMYD